MLGAPGAHDVAVGKEEGPERGNNSTGESMNARKSKACVRAEKSLKQLGIL